MQPDASIPQCEFSGHNLTVDDVCAHCGRTYVAVGAQHKALRHAFSGLSFRMERSRPIWRNKHTGKEVRVLDLAVDDQGVFQGGCKRFVVVTDEPNPPGPPSPGQRDTRGWSLDQWLLHWEPTGSYDPVVPGT